MKKLLVVTLAIGLISSFFMVIYFLVSTDIYHDYVCTRALASCYIVENVEKLPEWAIGKGQWIGMQIDFVIRIIFMVLIFVVMIKSTNKLNSTALVIMPLLFFVAFASLICYFLASSDIYNEYISKSALITSKLNYGIVLKYDVNQLPVSSECRGEWRVLQCDLFIRLLFMIYTIMTLLKLIRNYSKQPSAPQLP